MVYRGIKKGFKTTLAKELKYNDTIEHCFKPGDSLLPAIELEFLSQIGVCMHAALAEDVRLLAETRMRDKKNLVNTYYADVSGEIRFLVFDESQYIQLISLCHSFSRATVLIQPISVVWLGRWVWQQCQRREGRRCIAKRSGIPNFANSFLKGRALYQSMLNM